MSDYWQERGNCHGTDLDMSLSNAETKALCERCPVIATCLGEALREEAGEPHGWRYMLRGGLNPTDRLRLVISSGRCDVCKVKLVRGPEEDTLFTSILCDGCRAKRLSAIAVEKTPDLKWRRTCIYCGRVYAERNDNNWCVSCKNKRRYDASGGRVPVAS